ncbi:hypothetical protein KKA33_01680 [Patescibacteria group bacterium]|nr:hypothetical protein [Patescibacteria group bacterium]
MGDATFNEGWHKYEEIQFFFRKHWTHFLKPLIFGLAIGLLALFFFLVLGSVILVFRITIFYSLFAFLAILAFAVFIHTFFIQLFNYYFNVIIITDCRIIIARKTVFLRNDNDAIDLTKIQDIGVVSRGIFRNYLNYGALVITLSTSSPPVYIPSVPNPHYYLEQLNRVKREYILRRQEGRKPVNSQSSNKPLDYLQEIMPA